MKTQLVELFGEKEVLLSELTAKDFFVLQAFSESNNDDPNVFVKSAYLCLEMGLRQNIKPVPSIFKFWLRSQRRAIKASNARFESSYLLANVGMVTAAEYSKQIGELSGLSFEDDSEPKKKASEELADTLREQLSPTSSPANGGTKSKKDQCQST